MKTFWKFLGIFAVIWLIWYWTGGPQRTTNIKPYLRYDYDTNRIEKSEKDLKAGVEDMVPVEEAKDGLNTIKDNLENPSLTKPE